ncbi:porphobilinogen synthase [Candidatus Marinamargulisbacteria bacterium SCGC AG-410-N11]|nr:porphobilinogen synthase [Candidatus Marinamargulisbacteria bacterium SCGC AG-410-N11]
MYPVTRLMRYRQSQVMRKWVQENKISISDLIAPVFISELIAEPKPIQSLPGVSQQSLSSLVDYIGELVNRGITAVILFGIPAHKDSLGSASYDSNGIVQQAIRVIKQNYSELVVIADCCLCEYTDHGHCGVIKSTTQFDLDATLANLAKIAVSYAESGVDIIAPSGMIDGKVLSIRKALDHAQFNHVMVMSYAVKFASAFYGPFRDAAGSGDVFHGNRRHHQLNPSQRLESLREMQLDTDEGADFVIVKPISHYLDIVRDIKETSQLPLIGYHVSGEYAMLKQASLSGIIDEKNAVKELFLSMKRAGVSKIITYYANSIERSFFE